MHTVQSVLSQVIAPCATGPSSHPVTATVTRMGRWEPDARRRLQQSAMTLFAERGYDSVTVNEIAEHAGLTRRTFFNHFPDKREIFFAGSAAFQAAVSQYLLEADSALGPLDAAVEAIARAGTELADYREHAPAIRDLIASSTELRERDLLKLATTADALIEGLTQRGAPRPTAVLAARLAVIAFDMAWEEWIAHPHREFATLTWGVITGLRDVIDDATTTDENAARTEKPGARPGGRHRG